MNPRFRLNDRAKKFGRYSSLRAACSTRSLVCFGIALAAGESLTTTETVAGDNFRYSARVLKLTGFTAEADFDGWVTRARVMVLEAAFQLPAVSPRSAGEISSPQATPYSQPRTIPIKAVLFSH